MERFKLMRLQSIWGNRCNSEPYQKWLFLPLNQRAVEVREPANRGSFAFPLILFGLGHRQFTLDWVLWGLYVPRVAARNRAAFAQSSRSVYRLQARY